MRPTGSASRGWREQRRAPLAGGDVSLYVLPAAAAMLMAWPDDPAAALGWLACPTGGDVTVKLITAIIKPDKLDEVMRAVTGAGAHGLTVTEVRGFGQQYGHQAAVHPADREILVLPKLRIDVVVQDQAAGPVADAIATSVNTGSIGDGKIWVCPVDSVLRVRTGERDGNAM